MSKTNKDMINKMSGITYEEIENLDTISQYVLGKSINDINTMEDLWKDFTAYSKKGKKQTDWQNVGSDVIMEQWFSELSEELHSALEDWEVSVRNKDVYKSNKYISQEQYDNLVDAVNLADTILGSYIEL